MSQQYQKQKEKWFNAGKSQATKEILEEVEKYAKSQIKEIRFEKNSPINKYLHQDMYNMEMEKAEWEDFLDKFLFIKEQQLQKLGEKE
jgi:hypothetical protein